MKFEESIAGNIPQDTHGDILHSPSTTGDSITNKPYGEYNPPRGEMGWICPICGRGLAPSTAYCPCNLTRDITYLNGGLSLQEFNCNSAPPEAYHTTTATTKSN